MSQVSSPYGLEPVTHTGSSVDTGGYWEFPLTVNNTVALAMYDLVSLVNGSIAPVTASPTTTLSANTPVGVFMGCSYNDAVLGFVNRAILPANAVSSGLTNIRIKVADNPSYIFKVQAAGPVPASALGSTAALKNFGASDLVNGISRVQLDQTTLAKSATATTAVKIVGFSTAPNSAPGDAFTDVLVRYNALIHAYNQAGSQ